MLELGLGECNVLYCSSVSRVSNQDPTHVDQ